MDIKEQIRARRLAIGLSVQDFAKAVGVSEQTVRHWESGRNYPVKRRRDAVERALTHKLDWRGGGAPMDQDHDPLFDKGDLLLLGKLRRLSPSAKAVVSQLLDELQVTSGERLFIDERTGSRSRGSFNSRSGSATSKGGAHARKAAAK